MSEETRESAQKALDELVVAQIEVLAHVNSINQHTEAERMKAEAGAKAEADAERSKMVVWLERNRLSRHADAFVRAAGLDAVPADLHHLTEQDIATIGGAMTHIEEKRLTAALQALRAEEPDTDTLTTDAE